MIKKYLLGFTFITFFFFTPFIQAKKDGKKGNRDVCEQSFINLTASEREKRDKQILDLAIKFEEIVRQSEAYTKETENLINSIREIITHWESLSGKTSLSFSHFIALKEGVEQLETLLKLLEEETTSKSFDSSTVSQRSTHSLNTVISSNMSIEPDKVYSVQPTSNDHEFYVVFSTKVAKMVNKNKNETRVIKSMKALLKGPIKNNWGSTGIKKIVGHRHLFEIKIMGKKSVGNFRIGIFLHQGIYYLTDYTYQHIERQSSFLDGLHRALSEAIKNKEPVYAF